MKHINTSNYQADEAIQEKKKKNELKARLQHAKNLDKEWREKIKERNAQKTRVDD